MAVPLLHGAPGTANLGGGVGRGDREDIIPRRDVFGGLQNWTQVFPPFTMTSGSSSGSPLSGMRLQVSSQLCSLDQR